MFEVSIPYFGKNQRMQILPLVKLRLQKSLEGMNWFPRTTCSLGETTSGTKTLQ